LSKSVQNFDKDLTDHGKAQNQSGSATPSGLESNGLQLFVKNLDKPLKEI